MPQPSAGYRLRQPGSFGPYCPDDAALAGITAPTRALISQDSPDFFHEVATWLAARPRD